MEENNNSIVIYQTDKSLRELIQAMLDKMHLVNKIFNNETIRTVWDKKQEKYFISVVDLVGVISESKDKQAYWRKLKQRLKEEGNETVTNCHALKLKAQDGKYRMTDVVDIEGMFRIVESIPGKNAEPIKQWLAKLGSERIDETFDPSLAAQRAIDIYRAKGYDEKWIAKRLAEKHKPQGLEQNKEVARMGGHAAKVAREDIEKNLGESVVTKQNRLNYEYIEIKKLEVSKK